MNSENISPHLSGEAVPVPELIHHNKFIVSNKLWGKVDFSHKYVVTGFFEGKGELVSSRSHKELLSDILQKKDHAFAQCAIGKNILNKSSGARQIMILLL